MDRETSGWNPRASGWAVDGETNEVNLLPGELGFCRVEDNAVCCAPAQEVTGTVVLLERAWLGVPLKLGLDLVVSWDWGWCVAGHWPTLWGSVDLELSAPRHCRQWCLG